jgi:hypothetical protein
MSPNTPRGDSCRLNTGPLDLLAIPSGLHIPGNSCRHPRNGLHDEGEGRGEEGQEDEGLEGALLGGVVQVAGLGGVAVGDVVVVLGLEDDGDEVAGFVLVNGGKGRREERGDIQVAEYHVEKCANPASLLALCEREEKDDEVESHGDNRLYVSSVGVSLPRYDMWNHLRYRGHR